MFVVGASTIPHIYPRVLQALAGQGYAGCLGRRILGCGGAAMQDLGYELPRIPIPRTPVNKGLEPPSAGYMEPLWGRETLARQGADADERNVEERASPKGSEQKHPRVGPRALLQQRAHQGGPRLLRR